MSGRTFRVTVRGMFDSLSEAQRAELLAKAADHDLFLAAFTPEGNLTYDLDARPFFAFRYLDARPAGEADDDPAGTLTAAVTRAEAAASAWLDERGYGYRNLRSSAEDLAQMPLGSRARRESRRSG
ncbi:MULTISPECIES: DUF6204 family protein [unclassified Pseudofrankia]|uniref:DUF6204 family protein n=1 Tax=unclassified Pseudofrankia TaxID=2994372 RepID=UPI0008D964E3|nr:MULTISPECIES: DUF6204 family protein [unclassified Pseudofrankia]MDT3441668.1 DUF6204 family protein [Pseudofrankia sp. BMG5.37]OHV50122.1 hypothetical protein BCD48_10965 [Pseudofrankia sp. BMG5.36]